MSNWPPKECVICGSTGFHELMTVKDHSISQETFTLVECDQCQFVWTADAPDAASIGSYYESEDYISHSDTQKGLTARLYHAVRSRMLQKKRQWVENEFPRGGDLLDIGSGTGYFIHEMSQGPWKVQGIEVNAGARQMTRTQFGLEVHDQAQLFEWTDNSFDAITMWHVLEHVHDLRDYVSNIYRILKPHGAVFIAVPNINSPDAKTYGPDWAALDVPRHLWHFKHKDIHRLADQFGFRVERIMGMPMDAFYVSMLSEKYRKSGLGFVKGLWNGLRSNLSSASGKNSSSLVYVLKSKDAG